MNTIYDDIDNLPIAEDTKYVLKALVSRKEKVEQFEFRMLLLSVINGILIAIILTWLFKLSSTTTINIFNIISYFGSSKAFVFFILLSISTFIYSGAVSKELQKRKDKYDDLREETVLKIYTSWKVREDSKLRDEISKLLKDKKNINIRYYK